MTKVLVLYYSSYGHIEEMANAVASGAREAGATATVKRVPELVPEMLRRQAISSSTRKRPSPRRTNSSTTMQSSSELRQDSETWLPR